MNRALKKAITYKLGTLLLTLGIVYVVTGALDISIKIGAVSFTLKLIYYYFHEKLWEKKQ